MKVICLANQKGGVGKTTTTINLGVELAKKSSVLAIDLDPQGNLSKVLTSGDVQFKFEETSAYLFDKPKIADINLLTNPARAGECIINNFDLIVTDYQLSAVIETSLTKINREKILEKHLNKLSKKYDYVLLDTPPNLMLTTLNAIQAADIVLITIDAGSFALDGIRPLLDACEEIKGEEMLYKVLRNERDKRNSTINEFIDEELQAIQDNVINVTIRRSEDVSKANAVCLPVRYFAKNSLATNDYRALATEIKLALAAEVTA